VHVRRGFLNWGVFLVCLGAVPLALQLNVIDRATAADLIRLWPLILVGIGIGLVLRFSRADALGGLLVAATLGLLGGVLLAGGVSAGVAACTGGEATGETQARNGTAGPNVELNVELTCGDMTVDLAPGGGWLVEVRAGSETPTIDASGTALRLRSATVEGFPWGVDERESWRVVLPTEASLSAGITVSAGTLRATLGNGDLRDLSATFNAADATLDLASESPRGALSLSGTLNASSVGLSLPAGSVNASFTLNASSLNVCAAPGTGLRITYDDTLSSNNFTSAGLVQSGKTWQSANYSSAETRAELHVSANVSSITLNPTGGCK
jgi:hypothetical protein